MYLNLRCKKTNLSIHETYMLRALQLARGAAGKTSPNPLVGAVIVHEGKIIGEGFHKKAGDPHAEPTAVNRVQNRSLLKNSTLYITLEPCNHRGKTPACTDLILKHKIPKVIIGMQDPHSIVAGKGIARLRNHGVEVITGILEQQCKKLNSVFVTNHIKHRPYITLKWAQSGDGFIDVSRIAGSDQKPKKISGKSTALLTHKMRAQHDAIMVGRTTAHMDNPGLHAELWDNNHPVRVTLDRRGTLTQQLKMFQSPGKCLVFTEVKKNHTKTVEYIQVPWDQDLLSHVLHELLRRDLCSLFVEGGSTLLQTFIDQNLWDEAFVYSNNTRLHAGVRAPVIDFPTYQTKSLNGDNIQYIIHPQNAVFK